MTATHPSSRPLPAAAPARPAVPGLPPLAVVTLFVALVLTALSGAYAGWLIARVQNADHEVLERRVAELERELALRRQLAAPAHPPLAAPAHAQPAR